MLKKLYFCIDTIWQWLAERLFVRFQFEVPVDKLSQLKNEGVVTFVLTSGGFLDWLILSSWCRKNGFGPILVSNRKRILLFAKPLYFLQIITKTKSYSDLFLGNEPGFRLLFCSIGENRKPFEPTQSEKIISEIFTQRWKLKKGEQFYFASFLFTWRKHIRGAKAPLEYLLGLSSRPNLIGKLWYLLRRRKDSVVKNLLITDFSDSNVDENSIVVSKKLRRKIIVNIQQEMRVILGPRFQSSHAVIETLLNEPALASVIEDEAKRLSVSQSKVLMRGYKNLKEIIADYRFRTVEIMYVFLSWLFTKVFDGVSVEDEDLQAVRELVKTKPVVFIPCHRSHLDYLILPYLLFSHDMATPYIAAGINLGFWPLGPVLRTGGAFFIRRSFRGDKVYGTCLKRYLAFLLRNRQSFTFFIEGTRSRTGKMLSPSYGLLKTVLETYKNELKEDVALIPVSVTYDQVPEEATYSKELSGAKKEKESAKMLIESRKIVRNRIGKVYLRMAPSISCEAIYKEAEAKNIDNVLLLQKTAFQVCKKITDVTPLTPKSIICLLIMYHRLDAISRNDFKRVIHHLLAMASHCNFPCTLEEKEFKNSIEPMLNKMISNGNIKKTDEDESDFIYCEDKKRAVLNYYKNGAIHFYAISGIFVPALLFNLKRLSGVQKPTEDSSVEELITKTALKIRNLLKFEFFFDPSQDFTKSMIHCGNFFLGEHWGKKSSSELNEIINKKFINKDDLTVYLRCLGDLCESYLTALNYFKNMGSLKKASKKSILSRIVKHAESMQAVGNIVFPESISIQNYSNALLLFDNLNLLNIKKENNATMIVMNEWSVEFDIFHKELSSYLEIMDSKIA